MQILIEDIKVKNGRRAIDMSKVEELAKSIKEIGLLNPITVNSDYTLIAGKHRLEAFKQLGLSRIKANVVTLNDLRAELAEIDENLIRNELHYTENSDLLLRRKEIYEDLYPEVRHGGDRKSNEIKLRNPQLEKPSFVADVSGKTGKSKRTVYEELKIATLEPEEKQIIREREITKTDALELARLEPEERKPIIELLNSGEAANVKDANAKLSKPHVAHNSGNNEWYTPEKYIDFAREVMGSIDTDPASSDIANNTVQAQTYFTADDDGLTKEWHGNVWMNPPYGQPLIVQFSNKLIEEIKSGNTKQAVVLVNNATDTAWFQTLAEYAQAICFIRGRVRFVDRTGKPGGTPLQGQALLYFGNRTQAFISKAEGIVAHVVHG